MKIPRNKRFKHIAKYCVDNHLYFRGIDDLCDFIISLEVWDNVTPSKLRDTLYRASHQGLIVLTASKVPNDMNESSFLSMSHLYHIPRGFKILQDKYGWDLLDPVPSLNKMRQFDYLTINKTALSDATFYFMSDETSYKMFKQWADVIYDKRRLERGNTERTTTIYH